jgi:hypothetical protein
MALFKVIEIIDGDTIRITPDWTWNNKKGNIIKIIGYSSPLERDQKFAIKKLSGLVLNRDVELKDAQIYAEESSAILCRVYLNEVDVSKYFPEYHSQNYNRPY